MLFRIQFPCPWCEDQVHLQHAWSWWSCLQSPWFRQLVPQGTQPPGNHRDEHLPCHHWPCASLAGFGWPKTENNSRLTILLNLQFSPAPGLLPWPGEESPTQSCWAWQCLGRQPSLHAWSDTPSASYRARALHWSSSWRRKQSREGPGHPGWRKKTKNRYETRIMKLLTFALSYHGEIDIASIELHVDLFVDEGLTLLVVVLSDLGSHHWICISKREVWSVLSLLCQYLNEKSKKGFVFTYTQFLTDWF